ncbi:MAG: hypothetical protein QOE51_1576 [Actinoplanes sp.]|jgi:integrase|nr:hypothetical protein [Actinoplanes sp.]
MHRVLSHVLEVALRRGLVPRNVAKLMDAPTSKRVEQNALSLADAGAVLKAAAPRRTKARWSIGLGLGLRQGEALGLRWPYLDIEALQHANASFSSTTLLSAHNSTNVTATSPQPTPTNRDLMIQMNQVR